MVVIAAKVAACRGPREIAVDGVAVEVDVGVSVMALVLVN